jgi:hypothetical protein
LPLAGIVMAQEATSQGLSVSERRTVLSAFPAVVSVAVAFDCCATLHTSPVGPPRGYANYSASTANHERSLATIRIRHEQSNENTAKHHHGDSRKTADRLVTQPG